MRIRSTRPDFWRSARIASVEWEARLVLKGLESYVDDNGVGKDDLELIVSDVFSRDLAREPSRTLKRVKEAMTALNRALLLHRYAVDGTDFIYLSWWDSTQYINKPTKGRFPRPDGTLNYGDSKIGGPSLNSPEDSSNAPVGVEEKGSRGVEEKTLLRDADAQRDTEMFDIFWDAYDKKRGRKAAEQKYRLALKKPGVTPELLIEAARQYVAWQKSQGKHPEFTKDPATWLNGEHWNDERAGRSDAPAGGPTADPGTLSPEEVARRLEEDLEEPPDTDDMEVLRAWRTERNARIKARRERDAQ